MDNYNQMVIKKLRWTDQNVYLPANIGTPNAWYYLLSDYFVNDQMTCYLDLSIPKAYCKIYGLN